MISKTLFGAVAALSLAATSAFAQAPAAAPAVAPPAMAPAPSSFVPIAAKGDVVQTLQAAGQFTTLMKALDMTNLTGLLKGAGPITIFAPTDAAFAAMPPGELNKLLQPDSAAALQARIVYHLFNGALSYDSLQGKNGPVPGAGGKIFVDGSSTPNKVNDATLLQPGLKVTNGYVYIIDKVIAPGYVPPPPPAEPAAEAAPAAAPAAK